jgi:hypothetical protein
MQTFKKQNIKNHVLIFGGKVKKRHTDRSAIFWRGAKPSFKARINSNKARQKQIIKYLQV